MQLGEKGSYFPLGMGPGRGMADKALVEYFMITYKTVIIGFLIEIIYGCHPIYF